MPKYTGDFRASVLQEGPLPVIETDDAIDFEMEARNWVSDNFDYPRDIEILNIQEETA